MFNVFSVIDRKGSRIATIFTQYYNPSKDIDRVIEQTLFEAFFEIFLFVLIMINKNWENQNFPKDHVGIE